MIISLKARALCLGALLTIAGAAAHWAEAADQAPNAATPVPWDQPASVGSVTGVPEYDSIGFIGGACAPSPVYSAQPRLIGSTAGNPERDTYGLIVEDNRPCTAPVADCHGVGSKRRHR